ncbi:unnamed protein product [Urochloa humidicola]
MGAPPWVLLHRAVEFVDGESAGTAIATNAASAGGEYSSPQEAMAAMKPAVVMADPPEVTYLSMLWQTPAQNMGGIYGGEISSTDEGLVVLYTGSYRPGNGGFSGAGCYLVYDASNGSVAAIPPLPDHSPRSSSRIDGLGRSAAILRHRGGGEGAYVLAELVTTHDRALPDAELYLWWSAANPAGRWTPRAVRLPLPPKLCGPTNSFQVDMAFSFAGSRVCWVDLFAGVLVCDLLGPEGPHFSFAPLPESCQHVPYNRMGVEEAEQLRSMGCTHGAIKFVCKDALALKTWVLSSDFKEWKETAALRVEDIWGSESFRGMGLPRIIPTCPVLSAHEDEVVYAALNDIQDVNDVDEFGDVIGWFPELKAHYLLRLNMLQNKVLSFTKYSTDDLAWLRPSLLSSELSAYIQDANKGSTQVLTTTL